MAFTNISDEWVTILCIKSFIDFEIILQTDVKYIIVIKYAIKYDMDNDLLSEGPINDIHNADIQPFVIKTSEMNTQNETQLSNNFITQ